ncbi:MAG TPA: hypothetical protein PKW95_12925 [bacterium]|nr:hypothetical protein [bacterium]
MLRNLFVIVVLSCVALSAVACGDPSEKGKLDNSDYSPGGGGDGDGAGPGGIPGECTTLNDTIGNWLALDAVDGPFDDVQPGDTFVAVGRYRLVSPDEAYVTGTVCGTVCEETKVTPPLPAGTGEFRTEFTAVAVPDPDQARNCFNLTMLDPDGEVILRCSYHL